MNNYFSRPEISVSDIKKFLVKMGHGREMPENLQAIFAFGSNFHAAILEPHLVTEVMPHEKELLDKMRNTFWSDPLCRAFLMAKDFKREHEFYEDIQVGKYAYRARCKTDGVRPAIGTFLELKGLSVSTKQSFEDSLVNLDYDMAVVHYLLTSKTKMAMIVGISKKHPDRMFKRIVKQYDEFYAVGEEKLKNALALIHEWSPEDVKIAA